MGFASTLHPPYGKLLITLRAAVPNYRRWRIPGGSYFFTVVTEQRRPFLTTDLGRECLREAFHAVQQVLPFEVFAIVLLPDHFHCIWNLPGNDDDFSTRLKELKAEFTKPFLAAGGPEAVISVSRQAKGERGIWQRRFWEHLIENDDDLKACLDYLHYNPVKHGHVSAVRDWPWSTFHRFVKVGEYPDSWGLANNGNHDTRLFGDGLYE